MCIEAFKIGLEWSLRTKVEQLLKHKTVLHSNNNYYKDLQASTILFTVEAYPSFECIVQSMLLCLTHF